MFNFYTCHYCSKPLTLKTKTKDHIIPKSKGGTNSKENLVDACKRCNSMKSSRDYDEFICFQVPNIPLLRQHQYKNIIYEPELTNYESYLVGMGLL